MNRRAVDSDVGPGVDEKFNRRRVVAMMVLLMIVAAGATLGLGAGSEQVAAIEAPEGVESTIAETTPLITRPPVSVNDFIPEDQDLTTCIGVLERPGCGSESRGGWRQTLVFVALFVGLVVVFGNVAYGVRKRDRQS